MGDELVKWFSELSNKDIAIAGGKGASLAEMSNNSFPVPPGFIITAQAYAFFIEKSGIGNKISDLLSNLNVNDTAELEKKANEIKKIIIDGEMPVELEEAIIEAYDILDAKKIKLKKLKGAHWQY